MSYKWAAPNIYLNTDNHRYYVRVQVDGKAIWKSTGETNLRAASERARELLTTFKDGGPQAPVPSFEEYWETYRDTYTSTKAPRTQKRDANIGAHASVKTTEEVYAHLLTEDLGKRSRGIRLGIQAGKLLQFPKRATS